MLITHHLHIIYTSYLGEIKFYDNFHNTDSYLLIGILNNYLKLADYIGLARGVKFQV